MARRPLLIPCAAATVAVPVAETKAPQKTPTHSMALAALAMAASAAVLGPGDAMVVMYNYISSSNSKYFRHALGTYSSHGSSRGAI